MAEHPMACPEWQEDLASWLVAQIEPERERLLLEHLEICAVCRAEADSLLAITAMSLAADVGADIEGLAAGLTVPPVDLGARIAATISAERRRRRGLRAGAAALVGAAAAVVAVVAVVAVQRDTEPAPLQGDVVAFTIVPDGAQVEAILAEADGGSLVQLTAEGLDPDITYAMWLTPPGGGWDDRVPAGTFRPDENGDVDVRLSSPLPVDQYGRAWATTPDGEIALDTQ
jgi:hypothetical protein